MGGVLVLCVFAALALPELPNQLPAAESLPDQSSRVCFEMQDLGSGNASTDEAELPSVPGTDESLTLPPLASPHKKPAVLPNRPGVETGIEPGHGYPRAPAGQIEIRAPQTAPPAGPIEISAPETRPPAGRIETKVPLTVPSAGQFETRTEISSPRTPPGTNGLALPLEPLGGLYCPPEKHLGR